MVRSRGLTGSEKSSQPFGEFELTFLEEKAPVFGQNSQPSTDGYDSDADCDFYQKKNFSNATRSQRFDFPFFSWNFLGILTK